MRNSWKLGLFTALCVSTTIVGCGDDDDDTMNTGGSAGNHAGAGGSSAGKGGSNNGGSSAGNPVGGSAGKGGTTNGGSAAGGKGGTAGSGGTTAPVGGEGGRAEGGMGGAGGEGPTDCVEEAVGGSSDGAGGTPGVSAATVLVDNITVKNGATVVKTWAFANGDDILDVIKGDIGDKWLRPPFDQGADNVALLGDAHNVFSKCDGKPAGSLLNVVPFEKANQYYKVSIGFAQADWSGYIVSADVKLVSGGNEQGACAVNATLFVQDGAGDKSGTAVQLNAVDGWKSMTLTVPASTMVDHLSVNISDYTCL